MLVFHSLIAQSYLRQSLTGLPSAWVSRYVSGAKEGDERSLISHFLAVYIKRDATPQRSDAPKVLSRKAFRASFTLMAARYIAAADAERKRDLALRARRRSGKSVAKRDDLRLPLRQTLFDKSADQNAVVPILNVGVHRVVHAYDVHEVERIAVLIRVDGLVERHLALQFLACAEIHQDLVFHTPCRVGRKTRSLFRSIA